MTHIKEALLNKIIYYFLNFLTKTILIIGLINYKDMYQNPRFMYFKKDEAADSMFRKWFAKGDSETRKQMLKY